jgi:hypothetical protein
MLAIGGVWALPRWGRWSAPSLSIHPLGEKVESSPHHGLQYMHLAPNPACPYPLPPPRLKPLHAARKFQIARKAGKGTSLLPGPTRRPVIAPCHLNISVVASSQAAQGTLFSPLRQRKPPNPVFTMRHIYQTRNSQTLASVTPNADATISSKELACTFL